MAILSVNKNRFKSIQKESRSKRSIHEKLIIFDSLFVLFFQYKTNHKKQKEHHNYRCFIIMLLSKVLFKVQLSIRVTRRQFISLFIGYIKPF